MSINIITRSQNSVAFYATLSLFLMVCVVLIFFVIGLLSTVLAYSAPTFLLALIFGMLSLASENVKSKNKFRRIAIFFKVLTGVILFMTLLHNIIT